MKRVAIIGAGVSGLASARRAIEYNLNVVVFEESGYVGGIWMYSEDPANGSSPIYSSLRTNLPVQLMEFTGFEFKAESGLCYPPHNDVLKYINDFADHYDLRKFIKVDNLKSLCYVIIRTENEWRVDVENLSGDPSPEHYLFDAVIVCNGHYSIPFVPFISGQETFKGRIIHSRSYRRNDPFRNQRLLVVGNGPSGRDIASECYKVAAKVTVSCRTASEFTFDQKKITIKPQIKFIQENRVFFEDDSSTDVDLILLCTGYLYDIPFLHESCGVKIIQGKVIEPLYRGFINIPQPSMCFIGVLQKTFLFPLVDLQAEVFIKHITGRIQLPDYLTMMVSLNEENDFKTRTGVSKSHHFYLGGYQGVEEYCRCLFHLGDVKPLAPVLFKMFERNAIRLGQPQIEFLKFEIIDDENYTCCSEE